MFNLRRLLVFFGFIVGLPLLVMWCSTVLAYVLPPIDDTGAGLTPVDNSVCRSLSCKGVQNVANNPCKYDAQKAKFIGECFSCDGDDIAPICRLVSTNEKCTPKPGSRNSTVLCGLCLRESAYEM